VSLSYGHPLVDAAEDIHQLERACPVVICDGLYGLQ
jgi:hypothetical protein